MADALQRESRTDWNKLKVTPDSNTALQAGFAEVEINPQTFSEHQGGEHGQATFCGVIGQRLVRDIFLTARHLIASAVMKAPGVYRAGWNPEQATAWRMLCWKLSGSCRRKPVETPPKRNANKVRINPDSKRRTNGVVRTNPFRF